MQTVTDDAVRAEVERLAAKRDELTRARDEVTDRLKVAVARLVESGMPEVEAARLVGVNRNTMRTWLGKQDYRNHTIRRDRPA